MITDLNQPSNAIVKHHTWEDWDDMPGVYPLIQHNHLIAEIRATRSNEWLYDVLLMPIDQAEQSLNDGRFVRYNPDEFEYTCEFKYTWWEDGICESMVQWIDDHLEKRWNMNLIAAHVHDITIVFSFESYVDAVQFHLRWR